MSKRKKVLTAIVLSLVAIVALGYLSNWISLAACEREGLRIAVRHCGASYDRPLRLSEEGDPTGLVALRLREIGETYIVLSEEQIEADPFPEAHILPAEHVAPFVVRVTHGAFYGTVGGNGGDAYVVNLFGLILYVHRIDTWIS